MFRLNPFNKKKTVRETERLLNTNILRNDKVIENQLEIKIGDVIVRLVRNNTIQPQNELTAIIPRAEIRRKCYDNGCLIAEEEIILNSITLVDAPSHTPESK
ncbi:MAG: hypothetical protein A4E55_00127 [Pelotomaculum sp. PtaU1.Bin035]|nr:MAG: hypothetical protein A4E55_00127 [Pelotomaculum sp. PtaU1.Bin035]